MVRAALGRRFGSNPKIEVRAPEEIAALPPGSIDVVVLHSVAQYLSPKSSTSCSSCSAGFCAADGVFILGDIIPPHVSALGDAAALLHFAARNGFLGAALVGLGRTFVSDYWRLRSNLGLTRYAQAAVMEKLTRAGFSARRAPANIGHNPALA